MAILAAAWCHLAHIALAINGREMLHKHRPAVDHSSSLLMAPPIRHSATPVKDVQRAKLSLEALSAATSFKSLRATAVSLCPHAENETQACSGHGVCTDDYRCVCSSGYGGVDCSVPNSCPSNCSSAGRCNNFGICECNDGYAGEDCSRRFCPSQCNHNGVCELKGGCQCFDGWSGDTCDTSACLNGCSGHGVCQNSTCFCSDKWTDKDCSRPRCSAFCQHGVCDSENVCQCDPGWVGVRCATSACTPDRETNISAFISPNGTMEGNITAVCGPHGKCGADGQCLCNQGWTGDKCDLLSCPQVCGPTAKCVSGKCVCAGPSCPKVPCLDSITGCSGNGVCFRGRCICDAQWLGEACAVRRCPKDCSGNGECEDGKCVCNPPFRGKDCTARRCPTSLSSAGMDVFFTDKGSVLLKPRKNNGSTLIGPNETLGKWDRLIGPTVCSGHGVCQKSGKCSCESGWQNPACSAMSCPKDCSDHGVCENFKCKCNAGWRGRSCSSQSCGPECEANHGVCNNGTCRCLPGWNGTVCNEQVCEPECSEHGRCVDGKCYCEDGWGGKTCAGHACHQTCSTHGRCVNDTCLCEGGWTGKNCAERACPGSCSGHGTCTSKGKCRCIAPWNGTDCSEQPLCPDNCTDHGICEDGSCFCASGYAGLSCAVKTCPMQCNKRGVCKKGECECEPGFFGTACELGHNQTCPNQCGGHGVCNVTSGKCKCEPGYDGVGCTLHMCKYGCSGHGDCVKHVCNCNKHFTGEGCETSVCPNNCTGSNGLCQNGTCYCKLGWTGAACGAKICPSQCSNHGRCNKKGVCTCLTNWTDVDCSQPVGIYVGDQIEVPIDGKLYPGVVVLTKNFIRVEFNKSTNVPKGKAVRKGFLLRSWTPPVLSKMMCRNCSGSEHGTCLGYKCACREGWQGKFCEEETCNKCSGHGVCKKDSCVCEAGWSGDICGCPTELDDTHLPTDLATSHLRAVQNYNNVCSGHGRCVNSHCVCVDKWTGDSCGTPAWMAPSYNCAAECVFTCMKKCSTTGDLTPRSRLRGDDDCYLRCSRRCNADCLTADSKKESPSTLLGRLKKGGDLD